MGAGASAGVVAATAASSEGELKALLGSLSDDVKTKLKAALTETESKAAPPSAAPTESKAAPPKINKEWVAAGYCPVSYFNPDGKAHKGSDDADAQAEYEGETYKLTNADVVKMFLGGPPPNFLPQYGGFCATAMSMGVHAPVSPDEYMVVDKKLYLFHTAEAKAGFEKDKDGMIKIADEKWAKGEYGPPPAQ
mmetsp:Transcript_24271/g.52964  ORF Transcript_24271/g.52964 Transcript_24271/m.52964 type:complete len:193 (-) Transcript_24271:135-713(-)